MATEIDKLTADFRKHLTERGTIEVLGQVPHHGPGVADLHANSVAAYRLGLEAGRKLRGKSSAWELIDAMLSEWEEYDGDVSHFYDKWAEVFG